MTTVTPRKSKSYIFEYVVTYAAMGFITFVFALFVYLKTGDVFKDADTFITTFCTYILALFAMVQVLFFIAQKKSADEAGELAEQSVKAAEASAKASQDSADASLQAVQQAQSNLEFQMRPHLNIGRHERNPFYHSPSTAYQNEFKFQTEFVVNNTGVTSALNVRLFWRYDVGSQNWTEANVMNMIMNEDHDERCDLGIISSNAKVNYIFKSRVFMHSPGNRVNVKFLIYTKYEDVFGKAHYTTILNTVYDANNVAPVILAVNVGCLTT